MTTKKLDEKVVKDDLDKYAKEVDFALFNLSNEDFHKYFLNSYLNGDRKVYQKNISETKKFDDTWIKTVESYFPSLDKISRDPKSNLRYDEDIVDIERAKKTGSKSVRHLASHTQLIRDIDEYNNVTPKKILIETPEQNYAIYENRFIMTLINRLYLFVRNRYEIIKNNVESSQRDHLNADAKFKFNGTEVEMNFDIVVKKDLDDKSINEHNYDLLRRTEKLNGLITGLKNSQFMKLLKGATPVHPPIMKTNIIMKNPEFRNAYNLWIFLDKYSILGYDVNIKEKNLALDDGYAQKLDNMFMANYATVIALQKQRAEIYNTDKDAVELVKKKTKVITQNPKDFVKNPDLIQMEDIHLNEYFLQKYRSLIDASVEASMEENDDVEDEPSDATVKKTIRQLTEIANSIYEDKFEISEDVDVLHKLEQKSLTNEYNTYLNQLRYAKAIREVKEVDYNNFYRTERRLLNNLSKTNSKIVKQLIEERKYEEREKKINAIESQIEKIRLENERRVKEIEALNMHHELMLYEKEKLVEERNKIINKVNEAMKEYDAMMIAKYEEERQRVLALLQEEKQRSQELRKQEDEARKLRKQAFNEMLEAERQKTKEEMDAIRKEHEAQMEAELEKIASVAQEYRNKLAKEAKLREEENAQKEKEAIAIFKVQQYEEYVRALEAKRQEEADMEFLKQSEEAREKELADQFQAGLLNELDLQSDANIKESLQREKENIANARIEAEKQKELDKQKELEIKQFEEEQLARERYQEQLRLQEQIEAELLALKEKENLDARMQLEAKKAEEDEQARLEELKRLEMERIQSEKFELERQRIEDEIKFKKAQEDDEKARLIALNALQREKEAKAISLVQEYETKNKELEDENKSLENEKKALEESRKLQEKFESDRLKIEAQIAEQKKHDEREAIIKANAIQREKETKAISLVQEFEKMLNDDAKSKQDNA